MSFDRKLDFQCPHTISGEALYLNADRRTVRPLRPISSFNSVRVRFNGEVEVPSFGYSVPAEFISLRQGTYTIKPSVSDTLVVRVGDQIQTATLTAGRDLTAEAIVRDLNRRVAGVAFDLTTRQNIRLRSRVTGKAATVMFLPGSTAAATLGIPLNREWRGRTPIPGWTLVHDPRSLSNRPTRYIVFDEPLRGFQDFVEIAYATVRQECRRCGGIGVENDWVYNINGDVIEVRDETLLIQEVQKVVYTIQGSNPFHSWYGTNLLNSIAKKQTGSGLLQNLISADIREAFRRWQAIKRQQEEAVGQYVSDEEYPFRILETRLTPSDSDPTVIYVKVTVQNRSARPIQIERGVSVPLPADLLGSSVQDGVIRQSLSNFVLTG